MKKIVTLLTIVTLMVAGCSNSNREETAETSGSASNYEEEPSVEEAEVSDSTSDAGDVRISDEEFFASLPEWDEKADPWELYKENQLKQECVFYTHGETSFALEVPSVYLHLAEGGTIKDQIPLYQNPILEDFNYLQFDELPAVFSSGNDEFVLLAVIKDRSLIKVDFNYDKIVGASKLDNYDLWKVGGSEVVKPLRKATLARTGGDTLAIYRNSDKLASVEFDLGNGFINVFNSNYFFTENGTLIYLEIPEDYSSISPQIIAYDCLYSGDWNDVLSVGSLKVVSPIFAYNSNPNELYAVIPEEIPESWGAYESLTIDNFKIVPLDDSNFTCYFSWGNDLLSWYVTYCYTMKDGEKLYYSKLIPEVDNNFVNAVIQENELDDPDSYKELKEFNHLSGVKPSLVDEVIADLTSFLDNWENSHPEKIYNFFKVNPGYLVDFRPENDNWYGGHRWLEAHPEYKEELQELLEQELQEE